MVDIGTLDYLSWTFTILGYLVLTYWRVIELRYDHRLGANLHHVARVRRQL